MKSIALSNGMAMPALGFGTFQTGGAQCENSVKLAVAEGYRLIDTAQAYGNEEYVGRALASCGVSEEHLAKFSVDYDETFGFEADLHPKNIIDSKRFEIKTPDVSIKVDPTRSDLIETRVIGGVKYIMICADENVEVNGVSIHIDEQEPAKV